MPTIPMGPEIDFIARDLERQEADTQVTLNDGYGGFMIGLNASPSSTRGTLPLSSTKYD